MINSVTKQIIGYCGALFSSGDSDLDYATKMLNLSQRPLVCRGVREETLRDYGITGILVYKDIAIVGAAHLPELLKYHGEDPSTFKAVIIQQVTTPEMKIQLRTMIDASKNAQVFSHSKSSLVRYVVRVNDGDWSDEFDSISEVSVNNEWFTRLLTIQYSPPAAVWKKAKLTMPTKGKQFRVTGPLILAATELDQRTGSPG